MESQSPDSNTSGPPLGSLTLPLLACLSAALILTAAAYPIAKIIAGWLGP
jgi:hypothetical protein